MIIQVSKSPVKWNAVPKLDPSEFLSTAEREEFDALMSVVRIGADAWIEAGKALTIIRDKRLYREKAYTFEAFCQKEFYRGASYASRLITGVRELEALGEDVTPRNERVVRELKKAPAKARKNIWRTALQRSPAPTITDVRKATHQVMGTNEDNVEKLKSAIRLLSSHEVDVAQLSDESQKEVLEIVARMIIVLKSIVTRIVARMSLNRDDR